MGLYNPYMPHILGQEWCPIRENPLELTSSIEDHSVGYEFSLNQSYTLSDARWYNSEPNPSNLLPILEVEVTEAGKQSLVGPVRRILIPCNNGATTGNSADITVDTSVAASLYNGNDGLRIVSAFASPGQYVGADPVFNAFFAGNVAANQLNGKRILQINVLYSFLTGASQGFLEENQLGDARVRMLLMTDLTGSVLAQGHAVPTVTDTLGMTFDTLNGVVPAKPMYRVRLPNWNYFWAGNSFNADSVYMPWIPSDLARFEVSAANRLMIQVDYTEASEGVGASAFNEWTFMCLEVFYCEENRVAAAAGTVRPTGISTNRLPMRTLARALSPTIGPGAYSVNLFAGGQTTHAADDFPAPYVPFNALRQLYPIPTLAGVNVNRPYPLDSLDDVDKTFERVPTNIIPQLTLHTSGGPIPEIFPYGRQAIAQVYGSATATQEILDSVTGGARSYPQVRYYARRWGNTSVPLILDSPTIAGSSVTLTPNAFDELPEILDGWKEVTLRFDTAPSMGAGTNPQWRWSAASENSANRWEVLGASAFAPSGLPGNYFNLPPASQRLGPATYGMPVSGAQVNLGWVPGLAPMVTATTDDESSDAVILFSTDPPTPTGLAVSPISQALATVDPNCPIDPSCIPTAMQFNRVSWGVTTGASIDSFNRIAASGWGATDVGQDWIEAGVAAFFSVDGEYGIHAHPAGAANTVTATVDVGSPHVEAQVQFSIDTLDTAGMLEVQLHARKTDDSNLYRAMVQISTSQVMTLAIGRIVASSLLTLVTYTVPDLIHAVSSVYNLKFRVSGTYLFAKLWEDSQAEPDTWQIWIADTSLTTGNQVALRSVDNSAAGSAVNFLFNNFYVQPAEFGALELQRFDPVDGEFNTIMLATSAAVTGFNDYEARVGQQSVYRLRERNVYDFAGLWTAPVTGTISSPGVTGADTALMLFTSNYRQDGSLNLAYSAAWEGGQPQESFMWPEGQQTTLQAMYLKNFPTAFRPLERSGEVFGRTILVNAAGIPDVAEQNGFKDLRDMAWASVPYICVRDELGNRWYSTVMVPQGNRRRMMTAGHLDMADVQVVEVTETPYPVDPS